MHIVAMFNHLCGYECQFRMMAVVKMLKVYKLALCSVKHS